MKNKPFIYLAGAMFCYGEDAYPIEWRKAATDYIDFSSTYSVINPSDCFSYFVKEHKTEREIMRYELRAVKNASAVLVNIKDIEKSVGTINEVIYAWLNDVPVIGFYDDKDVQETDIIHKLHPWLFEQIDRIFVGENAMYEGIDYIISYYEDWR